MNVNEEKRINKIFDRLNDHWEEAEKAGNNIIAIFLQGSQNYGLDYEGSDVDTKAMIMPSFIDIALNKQPISTTHIMPNDEHIDIKDVRLISKCFAKQNINYMEILFTDFCMENFTYTQELNELRRNAEMIVRSNSIAALNCMRGLIMEKYHALKHPYESKLQILNKYGYDPKQLQHLVRMRYFIEDFVKGEKSYKECLVSDKRDYLLELRTVPMPLEKAEALALQSLKKFDAIYDEYTSRPLALVKNPKAQELIEEVTVSMLKKGLRKELME